MMATKKMKTKKTMAKKAKSISTHSRSRQELSYWFPAEFLTLSTRDYLSKLRKSSRTKAGLSSKQRPVTTACGILTSMTRGQMTMNATRTSMKVYSLNALRSEMLSSLQTMTASSGWLSSNCTPTFSQFKHRQSATTS